VLLASNVLQETELSPGSSYCMWCPEGHHFDLESRSVSCQMQCCLGHGLKREIECAHPAACNSHHHPESETAKLPRRRGPRFAVVLRYFERQFGI